MSANGSFEARYTVVYKGDPDGMKILSGEPAPGRAVTVIVGDQWEEVATLRARATAAEDKLRDREAAVDAALDDACRMSSILLMAGEMTAQERRTARAVALGLAWRVRAALASTEHHASSEEATDVSGS